MKETVDIHARRMACRDYILKALTAEMDLRHAAPGLRWIDNERLAVVVAANRWAESHGIDRWVSVHDVEKIENRVVSYVDYAAKLALYVAERIVE